MTEPEIEKGGQIQEAGIQESETVKWTWLHSGL